MAETEIITVHMTRKQANNFVTFLGSLKAKQIIDEDGAPFLTRMYLAMARNAEGNSDPIVTIDSTPEGTQVFVDMTGVEDRTRRFVWDKSDVEVQS